MNTPEKANDPFVHLGWISIVLSIASLLVLTPVVALAGLITGVIAGTKGHVTGWIGGVLSFLILAGWLLLLILMLAMAAAGQNGS